jgi:hypothetical protein
VLSTVFHCAVLLGIGLLSISHRDEDNLVAIETTTMAEPSVDTLVEPAPQEFYFSSTPQPEIGANSIGGVGMAEGTAPVVSDLSVLPGTVNPLAGAVAQIDAPSQFTVGELGVETVTTATGPSFSATRAVRGAVGVGATGAPGAIDRITHEILLSLEERKTLVVWLFDQSGSLESQRKSINEHFERIYKELGVIEASGHAAFSKHDDKPLLTSVFAFGQNITELTPKPTDDLDEIKKVTAAIKNDESGVEKTFSAVSRAVDEYKKLRIAKEKDRRNVMLIVFTDEVGDDQGQVDITIANCRKFEIPVYVVGVPAPFGRKESLIKYIPPKGYDQTPMWVPVEQGPESCEPEFVNIGFAKREYDEPMESGFGSYALTRLCYETGGIYFTVHPNRNAQHAVSRQQTNELAAYFHSFFDPEVMRNYRPDYISTKQYEKMLQENKARSSLVHAASLPDLPPFEKAQTHFPKQSEAQFVERLSVAQRTAAVLEPRINEVYEILKQGEKDRAKITQPRWQAGYDLAMGRVLAVKVRTETYNVLLAKAKQGMKFEKADSDTWDLVPADKVTAGSVWEKMAEQGKDYLQRVTIDHKGTPWALLAARELEEPLSWEWRESHTGVHDPPKKPGNGNGNPAAPKNDQKKMIDKPLPKAPLPKL